MGLYSVTYTSAKAVEALARRRGMKDGDNTSFWDWVDDGELTSSVVRTRKFAEAVAKARAICPHDVCGEARVEEVVHVLWRGAPPTWETVAVWHVYDDTAALDPSAPDHRDELSLAAGDALDCEAA